jgi:anti-sigma B factor antagonist
MEISTQEYKRVAVVTVSGRVDTNTAGDFEAALRELIDHGRVNLALDLSQVDFLSSSGLRVMVTSRKAIKDAGGEICLAAPSERVKETLELSGLNVLFPSFPDREAAIASF